MENKNATGDRTDMTDSTSSGIKVFLSYAHEDETLQKEFSKGLGALKREGIIAVWWDGEIQPGNNWNEDIARELDAADLIVLLVSSAFLDSTFCYDKEMRRAVERHDVGTARVVPIIVSDCYWQPAPFAKLQGLPKGMKPVDDGIRTKRQRASVWTEVAKGIHQATKACAALQKKI
jgi:hypothetical protein